VLVLALRPPGGLSGRACFRHGVRLSKSYTVTAIMGLLRRNSKGNRLRPCWRDPRKSLLKMMSSKTAHNS